MWTAPPRKVFSHCLDGELGKPGRRPSAASSSLLDHCGRPGHQHTAQWVPRLLAPIEEGRVSRREWLGAVPSSRTARGLSEQMEKVEFLKELGSDRLILPDLPLAGLEYFARRMMSRKPAALARIKDPHRTIEVACFLRLTLLRLMDGSLTLLDHQISAQWRAARERVEETQAARLRRLRRLLGDLAGLADDETLGAAELRARLKRLIAPFEPERQGSQVAAIRQELGRKSQELTRLLKLAREAPLVITTDHKLAAAFAKLDALAASPNALPASTPQPFGPSWQALIDQPDRAAALGCFRAATLMALKRALRNRSVSVDHSLAALLADGLNLGLTRMADACTIVSLGQLAWVADWHIRDETYALALRRLVDHQQREPLAAIFGGGVASSSDGQFFRAGGFGRDTGRLNAH